MVTASPASCKAAESSALNPKALRPKLLGCWLVHAFESPIRKHGHRASSPTRHLQSSSGLGSSCTLLFGSMVPGFRADSAEIPASRVQLSLHSKHALNREPP